MPDFRIKYTTEDGEFDGELAYYKDTKDVRQMATRGSGYNTKKIEIYDDNGILRHVKESGKWRSTE